MKVFATALIPALLFSASSAFAQSDSTTTDGLAPQPADIDFVRSCGANRNESRALRRAIFHLENSPRVTATKALEEFRQTASPGGRFRTPRLAECYKELKKRLDSAKTSS